MGFLALDGALLLMAGMWTGRVGLVVWGLVFALGAVAVFWYWRRYLRQLRELNKGLESRFQELMELSGDLRDSEAKEK